MTEKNQFPANHWPDQVWIDFETGERTIQPPQQDGYIYGNTEWPVARYRECIVDTVADNPVTILSSGTGNGKSIFVPQALYESGLFRRVYMTQPRIVATRENAQFTKYQMEQATGQDHGHIVAYRTATEGDDILPSHRIREHTDGYTLQQMMGDDSVITEKDVLITDEAHERNPNIDIAIALALKKNIRLLIQSASINTERFADYCSRVLGGANVPVIDIPGQMYPVEEIHNDDSMHEAILKYAHLDPKNPLNIMALVSGRNNREEIRSRLGKRTPKSYTILELHSDQTIEEQRRAFHEYPGGKIILATDIGRMSLTVPGLHVVLDGGYHKVGDYRRGVRYLREVPVSQADVIQGKGRVGRVMPGTYEHVTMPGYPPIPRDSDGNLMVDTYDVPPIQRTDPAPYVLKLAQAGMRLDQLQLQDEVRSDELEYARRKLTRLGALALNSDAATEIGKEMQRLPLNPTYARMLVEARRHGKDIELMMAATVSACQQEGITMTEQGMEGWTRLTREAQSDMLVQLDVLIQALWMPPADLKRYNIVEQRLEKARRLLERLCNDADLDITKLEIPKRADREKLLGCIIAGCDTLFISRGSGYSNNEGFEGRLAKSTRIDGGSQLIVGTPLVLEHYRNKNLKAHPVIVNGTNVTTEQLIEHAPWRCTYDHGRLIVNDRGKVLLKKEVYFDGKAIHDDVEEVVPPSQETTQALLEKLFYDEEPVEKMSPKTRAIYQEIERLRELLVDRSDREEDYEQIMEILTQNIAEWRDIEVTDMYSLADILHKRKVHTRLRMTFGENSYETEVIRKNAPDTLLIDVEGEPVEVGVTYKNNKAFIEIQTSLVKYLEGIESELGGRSVYVWSDSTKKNYLTLRKAIEKFSIGNRKARRAAGRNKTTPQ